MIEINDIKKFRLDKYEDFIYGLIQNSTITNNGGNHVYDINNQFQFIYNEKNGNLVYNHDIIVNVLLEKFPFGGKEMDLFIGEIFENATEHVIYRTFSF